MATAAAAAAATEDEEGECSGYDGYCELGDVKVRLDGGAVGGGGGGGKGGSFSLCFWLYLCNSARSSSVILRQVNSEDQNEMPFLTLNEENKVMLFPLARLHKEAPAPGSSCPWPDMTNLSTQNECPLEKWFHVGCEVNKNLMRLHIDGKLVGETHLSSLSNEQWDQDDVSLISLVGNDDKLGGYVYNIQDSPTFGNVEHHYAKNQPIKLSINNSSLSDGIEEGGDGIWSIVGGKASCRRNFALEVVLLDAFGQPVDKDMEVVASLVYADNGVVVEKSRDDAEAPLLISCDGLEYPAISKPLPVLRGRAVFKLKMSQLSSKCENKLFRVSFRTLHTRRYPFLEAFSKQIRCISRNRSSRPLGFGKRVISAPANGIHPLNNGQEFVCDGKGNGHLLSHQRSYVEGIHPSKCSKIEVDQSAMAIDASQVTIQDEQVAYTTVGVETQNFEGTDSAPSDSDSTNARSSENGLQRDEMETFSDAMIFRYCLDGTYERTTFLKGVVASASEDDLAKFADQVSLYSGCSHHRNQILTSKRLLQEGADTWSTISRSNDRALWKSAIPEIMRKFTSIAHSTNRGLSDKDIEVLRGIANCGDDLGREEFDRLWYWLYPVASSISKDKINKLWDCTSPKWIEGLITREEAENALKSSRELLRKPGTFVLRFPTTRHWPHPDAGSIVVTYVGSDNTIHHKLLSLDFSDVREGNLQNLLLEEPELSQLGGFNRLETPLQTRTL